MIKFRKLFLCTVLSACILAGCGNSKQQEKVKETKRQTKEEVLDAEELTQIRKEALEAFEKISFDNIDIKCKELDFPEIDELAVYGFDVVTLRNSGTPAEVLDKCLTDIIPKLIGEFDTKYLYDSEVLHKIKIEGSYNLKEEDYLKANYENKLSHTEDYSTLPNILYKDPNMKKKLELFTISNEMNYSAGKIANILGINLLFGVQEEADLVKTYDVYQDDLSDTYQLLDKEVSVKEAVDAAETYWNNTFPLTTQNEIKSKVYKVYVFKFKKTGEYVFNLLRTSTYNGIMILSGVNGESVNGYEKNKLYGEETDIMSEGFMVESDKIDIYYGEYNNYTEPVAVKKYGNMLPFEEVIKAVSNKLADLPGEKFELNNAGLIFRVFFSKHEKEYDYYIVPSWEFVFRNPINEDEVKFFVDIETGEVKARRNGCSV